MKKLLVIHPFLFAIFPVLFLFAHNIDEVPAKDLLLPILAVIIATLILFFSLRLITKNYHKSGIIASCFAVLFFSYGHVRGLIFSLQLGQFFNEHVGFFLGPLWVLLFIIAAFFIIKSHKDFSTCTKFLNIVAITLVAISVINIGIYEIKTTNLGYEEINKEGNSLSLDNLPDIYYIILDTYAREDTLKEVYNYDNSEFIDYLTNKGFYVATKSRSNYSFTQMSLASSLNMEHLNYLSDTLGESRDMTILYRMIQNNKVSQFLKSKGYRYIFVFGGWEIRGMDKYADVFLRKKGEFLGVRISHFTKSLIQTTAADYFVSRVIKREAREATLYAFGALADIPNYYKEPVFVFAHIIWPHLHGPLVFDREGNPPKGEGTYIDRLIFVNKKVKAVVDEILSKSRVAPIIILQGDHGLSVHPIEGHRVNILNAYFLPEKGNRLLYESITPVNSFRLILNYYFDANYDLLKDESYFSNPRHPYTFFPVPPQTNY